MKTISQEEITLVAELKAARKVLQYCQEITEPRVPLTMQFSIHPDDGGVLEMEKHVFVEAARAEVSRLEVRMAELGLQLEE